MNMEECSEDCLLWTSSFPTAVHAQHMSLFDPASQPDPGSVHKTLAAVLLNAPMGTPWGPLQKGRGQASGPIPAWSPRLPSGPWPGQTSVSRARSPPFPCLLRLGPALRMNPEACLPLSSSAPSITGCCLFCITGNKLFDLLRDTDCDSLNSCLDQIFRPLSPGCPVDPARGLLRWSLVGVPLHSLWP